MSPTILLLGHTENAELASQWSYRSYINTVNVHPYTVNKGDSVCSVGSWHQPPSPAAAFLR